MKSCFKVVLVLAVLFCAINALAQDPMASKAEDFISAMNSGNYQKAYLALNSDLGFKVKPADLQATWSKVVSWAGKFVEFRESKSQPKGDVYIVTSVCKFEKGLVDVIVAVDNNGKVAGFNTQGHKGPAPAPPQASAAAPTPATQPS